MPTRNPMIRRATLALFTVALVLLAGCGGGTTTTATTTATTSPTAELEKYRAELKPKNEAIESAKHSLEKTRFTGSNYSEIAGALATYIGAYGTYLRSLEQTQAPISVARAAESYVTLLRQSLVNLEAASTAALGHDGAALSADLEKARTKARECSAAGAFYAEACRW
jgi:hypothetical protein